MNSTIEMSNEIPEPLYRSLKDFLASRPDWDQDRVITAALSLFLTQHGASDRAAAKVYLDTLFQTPSSTTRSTANPGYRQHGNGKRKGKERGL